MNIHALTQKELAELFNVTPRSIRDWHSEGLPRLADGRYDGSACVAWYCDAEGEFADQRQRLAAAQAEKAEAENAVRRGELLDVRSVAELWTDMVAAARAKLLSLPTKLGSQLVNTADVATVASKIRDGVHEALAELSGGIESASSADTIDPSIARSVDVEPSAAPDGEPVGRRKKKVKQRVERGAGPVAH